MIYSGGRARDDDAEGSIVIHEVLPLKGFW
jgi:hypothetical protein